jgi:hypothetical protein
MMPRQSHKASAVVVVAAASAARCPQEQAAFVNVGVSVGGSAGSAGQAGTVSVTSVDNIFTSGKGSNAILAQSIGGGGGDGGQSMALAFNTAAMSGALTASVGGKGAGGSETPSRSTARDH